MQGKTVGVDATTLEANAAMRSIERRDTGESYEAFVRQLAKASGIETPTRAELARFDRSRKDRKTSNKAWQSPQDRDAKIAKMKDGRTHLAHKAEHGVDLETGAILSVTVQDASEGDSATLPETLTMAAEQVEAVRPDGAEVEEVVADKGYHSDATLVALDEIGVRSYVSEPERGRRCWQDKKTGETPAEKRAAQKALYGNRRRIRGDRGRRLQRRRGELVERPFAHQYETGGLRRVWVRGHENVRKRVLIQAAGCNLGQLLRRLTGVGTPRSLQGRALSAICGLIGPLTALWGRLTASWDFQWTPAGLVGAIAHRQAAEQVGSANRLLPRADNTVFVQLLRFLPRHEFEAEARQHQRGQGLRVMSRWAQFVALGLAQLTGRQSLRDIVSNLSTQGRKLYHLGVGTTVSRSSLARVNAEQPYTLYETLFGRLLSRCRQCAPRHGFRFKNKLYAVDANHRDCPVRC